jgi:hypothetical protein
VGFLKDNDMSSPNQDSSSLTGDTGKHLALCIHPDTFAGIAVAANAAHVSVPEFLVDAGWEKARLHRDQQLAVFRFHHFNEF